MSIKSINGQLPKVTICVPVRNGARTIQRTLDSLLNQDYPNYEIIVSDNCSDDGTEKIVSQYASKGVKYFFNPVLEKFGESNWNHILTLAEGPFIALYHADDIYTSTMVRRQVEFLRKYDNVTAVFTMSQRINENDKPIRMGNFKLPKEYKGKELFSFRELFNAVLKYGTITIVPTMMTRKSVLDKAGNFNWPRFCSASDIDLYLRMSQLGPIGIIDEPLHKYRISAQQGTNVINKSRKHLAHEFWVMDAWLSNKENYQVISQPNRKIYEMRRAIDLIGCAKNLLVEGNNNQAKEMIIKELKLTYFITAFKRPSCFKLLFYTIIMLLSIRFGVGVLSARCITKAQQMKLKLRHKPLKRVV